MKHECEVYFKLSGENYDPGSLSIGLAPTRIKRKADPIPKYSSWIYSTGKIESDLIDVYEMSSSLIAALQPHTENILQAKREFQLTAELEVVLTITTDEQVSMPAIGFEEHVIAFLSTVGASIDIDTYRKES